MKLKKFDAYLEKRLNAKEIAEIEKQTAAEHKSLKAMQKYVAHVAHICKKNIGIYPDGSFCIMNKKLSPANKLERYSPQKIKALRKQYNLSQAGIAKLINTSATTVNKWESGEKIPSGPALKLLYLLDKKGIEFLLNDE